MFKGFLKKKWITGFGTHPVLFVLDHSGNIQHITYISAGLTESNYTDSGAAGIPFKDIIHPEDRSQISFKEVHLGKSGQKIRVTDGGTGWMDAGLSIEPLKFKHGSNGYIVVVHPAEARQSQPEAKELGHGFAMQVLAQMGEGLAISDRDENFLYVNNALLEMTGYTEEELIGRHSNYLVKEYHHGEAAQAFEMRKKEKKSVYEIHLKKKTGGYIDTQITSVGFWLGDQFQGSIAIIRNITAQRIANTKLNLFKSVVSNSRDAYIIFEQAGPDTLLPVYANDAFVGMSGISPEDLYREETSFLGGLEVKSDALEKSLDVIHHSKDFSDTLLISRKDGKKFWGDVTFISIMDKNIFKSHFATIIRDVTDAKKIESELREALEKAKEASREKQKFLASMSHEIRTPMSGVLGMAQLLANSRLDKEQAEYLDAIEQSAKSLTNLLNDLLAFSELDSDKIKLEKTPFNMNEALFHLSRTFEERAEKKEIHFRMEIDEALPEKIIGDRERYLQVLMQILANAFKFTENGSIVLRVNKDTGHNGYVRIRTEVEDTGVGMPDKLLNSIFEGFSKGDESMMTSHSGAGVGLAIVNKIVGLMDGTIDVISKQGKGTLVTVTIPFEKAEAEQLKKAPGKDKTQGKLQLQGLCILVADDHPINRKLLEGMLGKAGVRILSVENGSEVIDMLKRNPEIDLILMDVHMPVMNGLEATRIIRTDFSPSLSQIPILAVTASAMSSDIEACKNAGMDDFISKPFTFNELTKKITHYTGASEEKAEFIFVEKKDEQNELSPVNFSALSEMASGDEEMMLELMELFLEQTPGMIENLRTAFDNSNRSEMAAKAHTLKPTFTYMGMPEAFEIVKDLEKYRDEEIRRHDEVNEQIKRLEQLVAQAFHEISDEANHLRK